MDESNKHATDIWRQSGSQIVFGFLSLFPSDQVVCAASFAGLGSHYSDSLKCQFMLISIRVVFPDPWPAKTNQNGRRLLTTKRINHNSSDCNNNWPLWVIKWRKMASVCYWEWWIKCILAWVCFKTATWEGVNQGSESRRRMGGGPHLTAYRNSGLYWVHASIVSFVPSEET